jgi:hypothetical protein
MKLSYLLFVLVYALFYQSIKAQNIYNKNVTPEIIAQFADTSNKLIFKNKDSLIDFTNYFKYVLKFFPTIKYQSIEIIFQPSQHISKVKPAFKSSFQSPEKRKYKIYFSNSCKSTLDSAILKNLPDNSRIGLIALQLGQIEDLSTDGFFDILAWRFRQISKRAKKKLAYENELRLLELGLGYQQLSLSRDVEEKLKVEHWKDAKAYTKYVKSDKNKFISRVTIANFIRDLPVYASHQYK